MDTKLRVGWVVLVKGKPVKTGSSWTGQTCKLYQTAGGARRVANSRDGMVVEAFIEVPSE